MGALIQYSRGVYVFQFIDVYFQVIPGIFSFIFEAVDIGELTVDIHFRQLINCGIIALDHHRIARHRLQFNRGYLVIGRISIVGFEGLIFRELFFYGLVFRGLFFRGPFQVVVESNIEVCGVLIRFRGRRFRFHDKIVFQFYRFSGLFGELGGVENVVQLVSGEGDRFIFLFLEEPRPRLGTLRSGRCFGELLRLDLIGGSGLFRGEGVFGSGRTRAAKRSF